jgi:Nucleotidyltransferase domain.
MQNTSIERANEIINCHLKNIEKLSGVLKSVVLIGSLSNNSYTGNPGSDIDLVHILCNDNDIEIRNTMFEIIDKTQRETNNDITISRCIYRYSDLFRPYKMDFELNKLNKDYLELPIEILRMKESGIIVYGEEIIGNIDVPLREDIILFEKLSRQWNEIISAEDPELEESRKKFLENPTARIIAQIVLTRAMLDYYFATNKSCSSKLVIGNAMNIDVPRYYFQRLLELAVKWRYQVDELTISEEREMQLLFKEWRIVRKEKDIDFVPLYDA